MPRSVPPVSESPEVVAGVGMSRGVSAPAVLAALRTALAGTVIAALATISERAQEPGLRAAAQTLGVPVIAFTASELGAVSVPNPSAHALATVGTASVAEAAALLAGGELVLPRTVVGGVVIAAATVVVQ